MKEVIILGTGSSRMLCPFNCETWAVNGAYFPFIYAPEQRDKVRIDKLFLCDTLFGSTGILQFDIDGMNRLTESGTEVISLHKMELGKHILKARIYPFKRILKEFGTTYLSNTISYMLAYAISEGYEHITLYGVDMSTKQEYLLRKGGVEFWIGMAMGLGIIVDIAGGSAIMACPEGVPYGFPLKYKISDVDPDNLLGRKRRAKGNQDTKQVNQ